MNRRSLAELADNPALIAGIYNYCDRWCERCPLTSRCLVYATEGDDQESSARNDSSNEAFWQQLASLFEETRKLITGWANDAGIDLYKEDAAQPKRKRARSDHHPLALAAKRYANAASDWFREFDQTDDPRPQSAANPDLAQIGRVEQAREVVQWYQYQIAVKTMRALSSLNEEVDPELAEHPKDSDGSAKVALIGIDRSISGWRLMQLALPEQEASIIPLILQLERLRHEIETAFPEARQFIRPGFDEVAGEAH